MSAALQRPPSTHQGQLEQFGRQVGILLGDGAHQLVVRKSQPVLQAGRQQQGAAERAEGVCEEGAWVLRH